MLNGEVGCGQGAQILTWIENPSNSFGGGSRTPRSCTGRIATIEKYFSYNPLMIFDSSTVCGRVFFGSKDKQIVENDNAKPWKLTLVILTASSLLMSASYTMLVPFLPMYLIQELNVAQDEVNLWSGIIFAISFAISGIMAPIWGAMADKKSRKLMAVRAAICLSITYVLGGLVQDVWQLFGVRVLQGFASGLWPACLAIMTVNAPRTKLGLCLGTMQGAMTAGGVLGPLMGGLLAEAFGMRAAFFLGGVGLFIITLLIIFYIKEPPRKKVERVESSRPKTNLLKGTSVNSMLEKEYSSRELFSVS